MCRTLYRTLTYQQWVKTVTYGLFLYPKSGGNTLNSKQFGWNEIRETQRQEWEDTTATPGRILVEHKRMYRIATDDGELLGEISGKMRFDALSRLDYPAVGDWVMVHARPEEGKATIQGILPRQSFFSRKVAGTTLEQQIVASNVDTVFLVNALNQDFNIRRMERYLVMAYESGANPVFVLTKADLCDDVEEKRQLVENIAFGVPIHVVSALTNTGIEDLEPYLQEGKTVALLGSSGAGKSTLTNLFLGEEIQLVREVREDDDRGKHTTTHRELFRLPTGALLIDTPGMRELQLWEADSSSDHGFSDIKELAEQCKFRDCTHKAEPGCAVQGAIMSGELDEGRFQSYKKLLRELAFMDRKGDKVLEKAERAKWKKASQMMKKKSYK